MSLRIAKVVATCAFSLSLAAIAAAAWGKTPSNAVSHAASIKFEVIEQIPAKTLWHSMVPVFVSSRGAGTIAYWQSDEESFPVVDGWMSPGFVLAGRGDVEEKPVAVQVWTRASDRFLKEQSLSASESGEDAVALFGTAEGDVRLRIAVASTGEVSVDGQLVGKVE